MEVTKIIGIGFIAIILIIILKQYRPEFAVYISILAGVLIFFYIGEKLSGIIQILKEFSRKAQINNSFIILLLKITGIAILTDFAVSICRDSGESAIANKVDFGGKVVIISMAVPILSSLVELIINILP